MLEAWDSFRQKGVDFVEHTLGLDVFYLAAFVYITLSVIVIYKIDKYGWDELDRSDKSLIKSIFFGAVVAIFLCLLHFIGVV